MAKAELKEINLLEVLTDSQDFHSSIFLTYGANLAFFERALLPTLWGKGCRRNLIFMDGTRYGDTVNDLRGSVTKIGQRYLLVPIHLGRFQSFHPKLVLLLGIERGRLLIGSGNLTFTGYGQNREVFTCLDWSSDQPEWQNLFTQSWLAINTMMQRWGHSHEAQKMLHKIQQLSLWVTQNPEPASEVQLFHSLDKPLLDQISQALNGETVEKITVVTPFLDDKAKALAELYQHFQPKTVQLVLQDQRAVGNPQALADLLQSGKWLKIHRFEQTDEDNRYLHAKIYIFETARAAYALTGSANCSQAALLSTSTNGNVEMALWRKANNRQYFETLLKGHVSSHSTKLEHITLKSSDMPLSEKDSDIQLLDITIENSILSVSFSISDLPQEAADLQLRISTTPLHSVPLGLHPIGAHTTEIALPGELQKPLERPQSGSIWGVDTTGQPIDLNCNELWITNVDVLHREMTAVTPLAIGAGDSLIEGIIDSERKWRELYETLYILVELDIAQVRQKKDYARQKVAEKIGTKNDTSEKETQIHLVDTADEDEMAEQREIEKAIFNESEVARWFEYIRSRLPGAKPAATEDLDDTDDTDGSSEGAGASGTNGRTGKKTGRPPSPREGRRFVNLVKKYIASLNNDEYMQLASIQQKLVYYVVFQHVIWLLLQHQVINAVNYVDLALQINAGFFGLSGEEPPVLCPRLCTHLRKIWHEEWQTYEVPAYALTSLFIINQLTPQLEDEVLKDQIDQQALWVFAGLASVMDISTVIKEPALFSQVARVYNENEVDFVKYLEQSYAINLTALSHTLEYWSQKVSIALGSAKETPLKKLLCQAQIEYGVARYRLLDILQEIEQQTALCSNLVWWMRFAGDVEGEKHYGEHLVLLLQIQGLSHDAALSLFGQGKSLFLGGKYKEAVIRLNQARVLAKQATDEALLKQCEQYLGYIEFFMK